MANLFTSQTPASGDNSDGAPGIGTATTVRFLAAGSVSGIRFYATATVSGTYTVALYQVTSTDAGGAGTGTLLASKVAGVAPTPATWNTVLFDSPVSVVTDTLYRAVIHSSAGRYVSTGSFFGSDLVNGDIVADANGDDPVLLGSLNQGTFEVNAALTYPNDSFSSGCYFVDVEFTAGSVTPIGVGDAGASAEALTVAAAVPAGDAGSSAEALTAAAAVPASDAGSAADTLTAAAATPLGDGGGGVDSLGVVADSRNVDLTDGGSGSDAMASDGTELSARSGGGWMSYGNALRFNADQARIEKDTPPVDCPNDGEALALLSDGRRYCPADGWQWPAGRIIERG